MTRDEIYLKFKKQLDIYSVENSIRLFDDFSPEYLPVRLERALSKSTRSKDRDSILNFSDEINKSGHYLIIGETGTGKTTLLLRLLKEYLESNLFIPLYVRLKTFRVSSIENLFTPFIDDFEDIKHLLEDGKVLFLLDGFNELDSAYIATFIELLNTIKIRYPECPTILTTRPEWSECQSLLQYRQVYQILPINEDVRNTFIKKILPEIALETIFLIDNLMGNVSGSLKELARTPLFLIIICYLVKKYSIGKFRQKVSTAWLYSQIEDYYLNWERDKSVISRNRLKKVIALLAFKLYEEKQLVFCVEELEDAIAQAHNGNIDNKSLKDISEYIQNNLYFTKDEHGFYFLHQSFHDYFAGYYISQNNFDLNQVTENKFFHQAISFALELYRDSGKKKQLFGMYRKKNNIDIVVHALEGKYGGSLRKRVRDELTKLAEESNPKNIEDFTTQIKKISNILRPSCWGKWEVEFLFNHIDEFFFTPIFQEAFKNKTIKEHPFVWNLFPRNSLWQEESVVLEYLVNKKLQYGAEKYLWLEILLSLVSSYGYFRKLEKCAYLNAIIEQLILFLQAENKEESGISFFSRPALILEDILAYSNMDENEKKGIWDRLNSEGLVEGRLLEFGIGKGWLAEEEQFKLSEWAENHQETRIKECLITKDPSACYAFFTSFFDDWYIGDKTYELYDNLDVVDKRVLVKSALKYSDWQGIIGIDLLFEKANKVIDNEISQLFHDILKSHLESEALNRYQSYRERIVTTIEYVSSFPEKFFYLQCSDMDISASIDLNFRVAYTFFLRERLLNIKLPFDWKTTFKNIFSLKPLNNDCMQLIRANLRGICGRRTPPVTIMDFIIEFGLQRRIIEAIMNDIYGDIPSNLADEIRSGDFDIFFDEHATYEEKLILAKFKKDDLIIDDEKIIISDKPTLTFLDEKSGGRSYYVKLNDEKVSISYAKVVLLIYFVIKLKDGANGWVSVGDTDKEGITESENDTNHLCHLIGDLTNCLHQRKDLIQNDDEGNYRLNIPLENISYPSEQWLNEKFNEILMSLETERERRMKQKKIREKSER